MPPKGKKATSKTSKRPQDSPDSDDELKRSVPKKPGKIRGFCARLCLPQRTVWPISWQNAYEQHVESLKKSAMAQKATIDEAKKISDQFLQSVKDLEDNHLRLDAVEQCTMEEEMENLKMKLTTENQHQNVMAMETCLFSLLSEDYEEKL
ncbi:hypothetical protein NN561_018815 [Cricetulus griseus]